MDCPRCGQPAAQSPSCPRCGVIFAKVRSGEPRPAARPPAGRPVAPSAPRTARRPGRRPASRLPALLLGLGAALAGGLVWTVRPRRPAPPPPPVTVHAEAPAAPAVPPEATAPPATLVFPSPAAIEAMQMRPDAADEDRQTAEALALKLQARRPMDPADLQAALRLYSRHPAEAGAQSLLEGVFLASAAEARGKRDHAAAAADLHRARLFLPASRSLSGALLSVLLEAGDWSGAEKVAREVLGRTPDEPEAVRGLAYALIRQDRSREAAEVLRLALDRREDPATRALYAQIQNDLAGERGMTEQRLAYFNVRYDGAAHENVGREILRQLERHRATLVRTFDHVPGATIPVTLFSQQGYYDSTGAPAWAGGHYDTFDGRIRIPIGGLTEALTPDMDGTLIHELTHAFIVDRSRGVAPREIHEGMAQFMEGKRIAQMLDRQQVQALADGRIAGVSGFYLGALSLAEFLMAERGQGGINDLLRAMGDTGDLEASFSRVYGRSFEAVKRDWASRLQREHGS
jgi:tetratricopeptide (TPR) repeat protein